jgi:hypothetical protein
MQATRGAPPEPRPPVSEQNPSQYVRAHTLTRPLRFTDNIAFGALLPSALGLPCVDLDVGVAGSLYEPLFYGAPSAPAYVPAVGTFLPTNGMSLPQRAANVAATLAAQLLLKAVYWHPAMWVQKLVRKHDLPLR